LIADLGLVFKHRVTTVLAAWRTLLHTARGRVASAHMDWTVSSQAPYQLLLLSVLQTYLRVQFIFVRWNWSPKSFKLS